MSFADTIVAQATAVGTGAIGIVRLSGGYTKRVVVERFRLNDCAVKWEELEPRRFYLGQWMDVDGSMIDEVQVVTAHGPKSYTGEDGCEIHCHGGQMVLERIVVSCLGDEVRVAEPGEFTRRAFMNDRMDLSQAEAVADLIHASTEVARQTALQQVRGGVSDAIENLRMQIVNCTAEIEARLDFSDEDINPLDISRIRKELEGIIDSVDKLIESSRRGRVAREGARVAICGRPNTGKSSLLNLLCGRRKALVTPHPGTTRDTIECEIDLKGYPVTFVDTAGIRSADDPVEKLGVDLSHEEIDLANLVLWLVDASEKLTEEDLAIDERLKQSRHLIVMNKSDLPAQLNEDEVYEQAQDAARVVHLSAESGEGLDQLIDLILEEVLGEKGAAVAEGVTISNRRHVELLYKTKAAMERAYEGYVQSLSGEFISLDLNEAISALAEILGREVGDDVLDQVFKRFCIGK